MSLSLHHPRMRWGTSGSTVGTTPVCLSSMHGTSSSSRFLMWSFSPRLLTSTIKVDPQWSLQVHLSLSCTVVWRYASDMSASLLLTFLYGWILDGWVLSWHFIYPCKGRVFDSGERFLIFQIAPSFPCSWSNVLIGWICLCSIQATYRLKN